VKLPIHTIADAPDPAKPLLEAAKKKYNFVPNILAVMASEPPLLEAYMSLSSLFERSSLTPIERQLVLLTVSQANGCQYCMAAHSAMAMMAKVPEPYIAAVRNGGPEVLQVSRTVRETCSTSADWRRKAGCTLELHERNDQSAR